MQGDYQAVNQFHEGALNRQHDGQLDQIQTPTGNQRYAHPAYWFGYTGDALCDGCGMTYLPVDEDSDNWALRTVETQERTRLLERHVALCGYCTEANDEYEMRVGG